MSLDGCFHFVLIFFTCLQGAALHWPNGIQYYSESGTGTHQKIQHKWVTCGSCLKKPESLRFRTQDYVTYLMFVIWLVKLSPVSSCRHYWRITGRSYHTVQMLEGGVFKSQVSWKTGGNIEEVFIWPLSMMSLTVIDCHHLFLYPFVSHSH